jgi:hypothetical protein
MNVAVNQRVGTCEDCGATDVPLSYAGRVDYARPRGEQHVYICAECKADACWECTQDNHATRRDCHGDCSFHPPDGYVRPGTTMVMYVNAYAVTRHFGGHEEGGWWYNAGSPLASIPVRATSMPLHDDSCVNCHPRPWDQDRAEGPIQACRWGFHVVPDEEEVERMRAYLVALFEDEVHGDIYSVCGGQAVEVQIEDHMAEAWPSTRPRYE